MKICLRLLFAPCRYRRVSWQPLLRPRAFDCPWLSPVFFPVPCYGYMSASMTLAPGLRLSLVPYPRFLRMGLEPLLEAPLSALQLPAHSYWWSSLWQRVFGSSWISPWFFPDRRYGYKATCFALDPVRRLSFVLGPISFWMGFALCLWILFAPCGCWRAYCGPHCGHEFARVLASLSGSSPSGVRHLSRNLFLSLRPRRSRSPIPSLAPSWWSPCPLMRWALLKLSGYVLSGYNTIQRHRFSADDSALTIQRRRFSARQILRRRFSAAFSTPERYCLIIYLKTVFQSCFI